MRELNLTEQIRQSVATQLPESFNVRSKGRWKEGGTAAGITKQSKEDGACKCNDSGMTVVINQQEIFSTRTGRKEQDKVNFNWPEIKDGS